MTKKDAFTYLTLSGIGIAGYFIGHYAGAIITGAACLLMLLVAIGRKAAAKAASRIDKNIRDMIVNQNTTTNGDYKA